MRTLFVGAGATGGYFGGRLAQAGKDVTFLVRPGRAAVLARRGLRIKDPDGETTINAHTVTADKLEGSYDLVVLAVKSYGLEQALTDVAPAVGPRTVIVPLLNGIRHIDRLRDEFGPERAWGGVCLVAATLDDEGDVVQMTGMHRLGYGPLDGSEDERLPDVTGALSGEEFDSNPTLTIVRDMWEKWVVLASMGAITTLMRGTLADVNGASGGQVFSRAVAGEAVAIATAAGHEPRPEAVQMLHEQVLSKQPMGSSMFRDMTSGLPVEADAILGDMVKIAQEYDVPAPLISAAYTNLAVYSAKRAS